MKKLLIAIFIIIIILVIAAFFIWKAVLMKTNNSKMYIMESGKERVLSSKESAVIRKQVPVVPGVDTTYKASNVTDPSMKKNLDTINEIQRINKLNKRQSK